MFSKKAIKFNEFFTVDLMLCSKYQIDGEDFVNFLAFFYELCYLHTSRIFVYLFIRMEGSEVSDDKFENEPTSNPIINLSKDLNWKKREVLLECIHPPCRRSSDVDFFQIKKSRRGADMSIILVGTNPPTDSIRVYVSTQNRW